MGEKPALILLKGGLFDGHQVMHPGDLGSYEGRTDEASFLYRWRGETDEATGLPIFRFVEPTIEHLYGSGGHA